MIRVIITLSLLALTISGEMEVCLSEVKDFCSRGLGEVKHCDSLYSGKKVVQSDLQKYTATHIDMNHKFLLMSAYFNNYEVNREGFSKLYRKLADDAWEDALHLIKYMAKRGYNMDYKVAPKREVSIDSYKMNELESLSKTLDMYKVFAEEAHFIHSQATVRDKKYHDAETINFLESKFVDKHSRTIRDLAGYTNDLHQLIAGNGDSSLSIYMFDEYLKKTLE